MESFRSFLYSKWEKLCDEISENIQNRIKLIIKESLHQKKQNAPSIVKHLI